MRFSFQTSKFDSQAYLDALDQAIREKRDKAAREFLVFLFREVPVWSGAARATLLPLARLVGEISIPPINPKTTRSSPNWLRDHSVPTGERKGFGKIDKHSFTYAHGLLHWEQEGGGKAPWHILNDAHKLIVNKHITNNTKAIICDGFFNPLFMTRTIKYIG